MRADCKVLGSWSTHIQTAKRNLNMKPAVALDFKPLVEVNYQRLRAGRIARSHPRRGESSFIAACQKSPTRNTSDMKF